MTSINYIIWFSLIFNSETYIQLRDLYHKIPCWPTLPGHCIRIVNKEWDCSHNKGFKSTFERGTLPGHCIRIVNKEWDCSHNKGFKSTFERGILHVYRCWPTLPGHCISDCKQRMGLLS
ncbi:hypothetical protein ACFE04_020187 [Oxalis oulophora]